MNCRKARQLIPSALDRQLDQATTDQLMIHLTDCHACAHIYTVQGSVISQIEDTIHAIASDYPATDISHAISAALAPEINTRPGFLASLLSFLNWDRILSTPRAKIVTASLTLIAASFITTAVFAHYTQMPTVAMSQFYSGHLVSFTIRIQDDGTALAGTDTHRYCKTTHARQEGLR